MVHVLDNPIWNGLISGNKQLGKGNETAKYFNRDVSPFAAVAENTQDNLKTLFDITPDAGPFPFFAAEEVDFPKPWNVVYQVKAFQMVYAGEAKNTASKQTLIPLTKQHIPQMLELTRLTNPGPFLNRTIDFGNYYGIFEGEQLVAMAGQRLHPFEYIEISAVCTHPDYSGNGYASQLLSYQIDLIKSVSAIPFLHVRSANDGAVKVYEKVGFVTRKEINIYVLEKS